MRVVHKRVPVFVLFSLTKSPNRVMNSRPGAGDTAASALADVARAVRLHTLLGRCVGHMRARAADARPSSAPADEAAGASLPLQPPGGVQHVKVLALLLLSGSDAKGCRGYMKVLDASPDVDTAQ